MIEHKIETMNGIDLSVRHLESGTHLSCHCVKVSIDGKYVIMSVEDVHSLIDILTKELPVEYSPEGFRSFMIGKPFDFYYENPSELVKIARNYGLVWEELHACLKDSEESKMARSGDDECCLWLEHENGVITDLIWG